MARNHRSGHQAGANDGGRGDPPALGPDVLLGIWSTWMKSGSDMSQQWMSAVRPWWQLPDNAEQLTEQLAHDPLLKWIDQMWNANPLHDVIPLDWAGIAWALRTVWLRSLNRPDVLPALAELNVAVWRSALDIWNEAGRRWWRQALRRAGMARQPCVPHAEGGLPACLRLAAQARRGGGHGRRRTAAAGFSFTPVRQCNEPGAVPRIQPGGAAARLRDGGYQRCRRHA